MGSAIAIDANIYRHRKESRLTQDDLARHLGITKASVFKWETGQSYPDVELLPRIAAFFDVTVDALFGYELQMGKEDIGWECARSHEAFATTSFDEAHAQYDDALVKRSLVESVTANPAFGPLADDPRFGCMVESLREVAR